MSTSENELTVAALIAAFEATLPWPLDEFQREAIEKLEHHAGVLVSAPTSSGKTMVAEYAIWRCLAAPPGLQLAHDRPDRVIYTTPLKALSNQKYHDLAERYGAANVGLVTGEHTINDDAAVVVMTTEILRNVLYDEPARVESTAVVVLDEVHYIDDFPRGTVWEEVIIEAPRHIKLVGLSATVSNIDELARWMSELRGDVATVVRTERPVALEMWLSLDNVLMPLFDPSGKVHRRTMERAQNQELAGGRFRYARRAPDNDLLAVIGELERHEMLPAIYFIFSRKGCREALDRCALHGINLTSPEEKRRIDEALRGRLAAIADDDERAVFTTSVNGTMLRNGVAMHHAGMLPYAKETVEALFQQGLIKVVFATETLSLGLNMPARACVISSFTKFDGTGFASLTSGELTQLMGRAGRRGIDTLGHGIILKESDVEIRDIYDAAVGGEMAVMSKFAPTYNMVLTLLRTRDAARAEELLEKSFGQYQAVHQSDTWDARRGNAEQRLVDLRSRAFRHPTVRCTERTLSQFIHADREIVEQQHELRRAKRDRFSAARGRQRSRFDPGQRVERLTRDLKVLHRRLNESPCRHCPFLADHRAQRWEITDLEAVVAGGEAEMAAARQRYRKEFRALRAVLHETGFLADDRPTDLGALASSLYGESALVVSDGVASGIFDQLTPAELAACLVMVVAEDRGRDRAGGGSTNRDRFPTAAAERTGRALRAILNRLSGVENDHGLHTLRPLSYDYIRPAHQWASGVALTDIDVPGGNDLGDVVKAVKNLYSLTRQMEMALRTHRLHPLVVRTREALERDLIRRV